MYVHLNLMRLFFSLCPYPIPFHVLYIYYIYIFFAVFEYIECFKSNRLMGLSMGTHVTKLEKWVLYEATAFQFSIIWK